MMSLEFELHINVSDSWLGWMATNFILLGLLLRPIYRIEIRRRPVVAPNDESPDPFKPRRLDLL